MVGYLALLQVKLKPVLFKPNSTQLYLFYSDRLTPDLSWQSVTELFINSTQRPSEVEYAK